MASVTCQRQCFLRPTPFMRVGVHVYGRITPLQTREPQ